MENHVYGTPHNAPEPIKICDLVANTEVRGWLLVEEALIRTTKNGKPFRQLKLRDQLGNEITARQFELPSGEINVPQEGKVVLIEGLVEEYQHTTNIKLTKVVLDDSAPQDLFVVGTRHNIDELEKRFWKLVNVVQQPGLQALLRDCFTNEVIEQYRFWPAAVRHHGAVVGGLLEHTVHVALITQFLANLYPCNGELALTGALLHDIGKLQELEAQPGKGFTADGNMFGHIFLGNALCTATRTANKRARRDSIVRLAASHPGAPWHEGTWITCLPGHHRSFNRPPGRYGGGKTDRLS